MKHSAIFLFFWLLLGCSDSSNDRSTNSELFGVWVTSCEVEIMSFALRTVEFEAGRVRSQIEISDDKDCQSPFHTVSTHGQYTISEYVTTAEGIKARIIEFTWFDENGEIDRTDRQIFHIENDVLYLGAFEPSTDIPTLDFERQWLQKH